MNNLQPVLRFGEPLRPFVVLTAGRSRTMWLSAFLTYGHVRCGFEYSTQFASLHDALTFLKPGFGTTETSIAPSWPLLLRMVPDVRLVVVLREPEEIVASIMRANAGQLELDESAVRRTVTYFARCLRDAGRSPRTLSVNFADLATPETCKRVFEFVLPYKFDLGWWEFMSAQRLEPDFLALSTLFQESAPRLLSLSRDARHWMLKLAREGQLVRSEL